MLRDKKCEVAVDKKCASVVKMIFRKAASGWSSRKIYRWLKDEVRFRTRGDKPLTLSDIYRVLTSPFYCGMFKFPRKSGNWYQGKHELLITEEFFRKVQLQLKREEARREMTESAFTKDIVRFMRIARHSRAEVHKTKRRHNIRIISTQNSTPSTSSKTAVHPKREFSPPVSEVC